VQVSNHLDMEWPRFWHANIENVYMCILTHVFYGICACVSAPLNDLIWC